MSVISLIILRTVVGRYSVTIEHVDGCVRHTFNDIVGRQILAFLVPSGK